MNTILITSSLTKTHGSGPTAVQALQPTDLTVQEGEFVAVVGPSGSGKSTLLHLLGGLDQPTTGQVTIGGVQLFSLTDEARSVFRRRKIGFIFQFYNLVPVLTAEENITLPLLLDQKPVEAAFLEELLVMLGLTPRRDHLPNALSGGEQQRVAIARAMITKPAIILADEPTGNLDTQTTAQVLELLRNSIKRYGQTLMMITHDFHVAAYADRILAMRDGKLVKDQVNDSRQGDFAGSGGEMMVPTWPAGMRRLGI